MPKIDKKVNINLEGNRIFGVLPRVLKEIGGEIKEQKINRDSPFWGQIKVFVPSIWGWGGMKVDIDLKEKEEGVSVLFIEGYIAQLATRPLTKKMDAFLKSLSSILKEEFNYELEYTSSAPKFLSFPGFKWTRSDTFVVLLFFGVTVLLVVLSLTSGVSDSWFSLLLIPFAYYVGRKLLNRN